MLSEKFILVLETLLKSQSHSDGAPRVVTTSLRYLTPAAYAAHLTATDDRLRNPDQLRRSSVAPTAPLGVQNPETLTAAG